MPRTIRPSTTATDTHATDAAPKVDAAAAPTAATGAAASAGTDVPRPDPGLSRTRRTDRPRGGRPTSGRPAPGTALLRTVLRLDAWVAGAFGVFLLAFGRLIDGPLGLPLVWSVPFGVAMLAGAAALVLIARLASIPPRLSGTVFAFNAVSSAALVAIACVDLVPLTGRGRVFMLAGALVVAGFAAAEYVGHRRARAPLSRRP